MILIKSTESTENFYDRKSEDRESDKWYAQ